ncbi:MAG: DNA primase [Flavobacteriaceae bacterium]
MISKSSIDLVFETARVEEVIGEFVQLKKAGANYKGLSPFTDEKTPSFVVSPVKQIWKDFSTGKGGNAVAFLMEHEHFSYPEAIRYLAKKYQIELEETEQTDEQKQQAGERESMFLVSEFARDLFSSNLTKTEQGRAIGYTYFKERGISDESIKTFELGYAIDSWDHFTEAALKKGFELKYLEQTGLTIVKEQKRFDRFKGRVIFPIHSMSGRVLGFGGRILTADKKAAKYVNSPESDIYHKSKVLYGINQAKQSIAKEDVCYLVEGYTDVISFHQAGVKNVVASSGTALTPDQIRLIQRLTPNIVVLFDGDAAGIRASLRGIDLILEQGLNVRVLSFPEGEDPDSFARSVSKQELETYLKEESKDFITFKVSLLMEEAAQDPIKKAGLIRDIVKSISKIPDSIKREVYVQECSRIMDISENVLFNELAQLLNKEQQKAVPKKSASKSSGASMKAVGGSIYEQQMMEQQQMEYEMAQMQAYGIDPSQMQQAPAQSKANDLQLYEREIIKLLLIYGNNEVDFVDWVEEADKRGRLKIVAQNYVNTVCKELYLQLQDDEMEFANPVFSEIYYEIIHQLNQVDEISIDKLLHSSNGDLVQTVTDILMEDEKYALSDWKSQEIHVPTKETKLSKAVPDAILNLRRVLIEQKIEDLMKSIAESAHRDQDLEMIMKYTELKNLIFQKLNRVL